VRKSGDQFCADVAVSGSIRCDPSESAYRLDATESAQATATAACSLPARLTSPAVAKSVAAPRTKSCSTPNSGISQNAVANVPAIEPAVEIANVRPAVRPTRGSVSTCSRTAIGPTAESSTAIGRKRIAVQTTGSSRAPGSQRSTASITGRSTSGIASTLTAPAPITTASVSGDG
jgi:hypothetical protein